MLKVMKGKCLPDYRLQQFIDKECCREESAAISAHMVLCKDCSERLTMLLKRKNDVLHSLNILNPESIEIPEFRKTNKRISQNKKSGRSQIYSISIAASLLISVAVLGFLFNKQDQTRLVSPENQVLDLEFMDPNDAWQNNTITIQISNLESDHPKIQ